MKNSTYLGGTGCGTFKTSFLRQVLLLLLVIPIFSSRANHHSFDDTIKNINPPILYQATITGTVFDENGAPLPGVSVVVKGTTTGVASDFDGNYSINTDTNGTLVFSYVGYSTQEVSIGGNSTVDVNMEVDASQLEEVVVIGYGTQKRKDLTGAIESVSFTDKNKTANVDIAQALQGSVSGVNVGVTTAAGGSPDFSVRGQNSLLDTAGAPLIILDGIIYGGDISNINVNDVANIDVLKDASAAAVYGARASNGVIIITTKRGKTEKPQFSLNVYTGVQDLSPTDATQIMDADQFLQRLVDYPYQEQLYGWYAAVQENPETAGDRPVQVIPTTPADQAVFFRSPEEQDNFFEGDSRNWIDESLRETAFLQNVDLSVSGRTKKTSYYISGSYTDQEGLLVNDQFERSTLRANFTTDVTDWLSLGLNTSYSYRDYSGIQADLNRALDASPWGDLRTAQGNFTDVVAEDGVSPNPLSRTQAENEDLRDNVFLAVTAKAKIPWIKGLAYEFNYSNNIDIRRDFRYDPSFTRDGISNNGRARRRNIHNTSWLMNNLLTYSNVFADKHSFDLTLLMSREKSRFTETAIDATGFDVESSGYNLPSLGLNQTILPGVARSQNRLAYMARGIYKYDDRYILTGTVRRDGFSAFPTNNKVAVFPSASIGWIASEEKFLENVSWIDFLKFRASYGVNGNDGIPLLASFAKVDALQTVLGNEVLTGVRPNSLGNPDLVWETTTATNFGMDFTFANSRLSGSIDGYVSKTTDVIVERSLPRATGFENILTNIGEVANKGIEVTLSSVNVKTDNFSWNTRFNFSLNRNKLTRLLGGANDFDIGNQWFTGSPINVTYGFVNEGVTYTEEEFFAGQTPTGFFPGHYKVRDLDGVDGLSQDTDREIIGYDDPNYRFGIGNNLAYKNFSLNVFINSIQGGGQFYKGDPGNLIAGGQDFARRFNQTAVRPYWTPERPTTNAPGIFWAQPISGPVLLDRSFVRIQDVTLNYNFDQSLVEKLGLTNLGLYVSGKNIATFTEWTGWDPELGNSALPLPRTFVLGMNVGF